MGTIGILSRTKSSSSEEEGPFIAPDSHDTGSIEAVSPLGVEELLFLPPHNPPLPMLKTTDGRYPLNPSLNPQDAWQQDNFHVFDARTCQHDPLPVVSIDQIHAQVCASEPHTKLIFLIIVIPNSM